MTLQLLHSEVPYIWGKFDILFYQCVFLTLSCLWIYLHSFFLFFGYRSLYVFYFSMSLSVLLFLCLILLSQLLQSVSLCFFAWFLFGSRKECLIRERNIEEGGGNRHHFRLFKFIPRCIGSNSESIHFLATPRQKCRRGGGGEGASEK